MHQNHFPRSFIIPHFYIFFYFCASPPPFFWSVITKGYISRAFPLFTIWKVWIVVFYWQTVSDFVRTSSGGSWNVFVTKGSRARVIIRLTRLSKRRPVFYSLLEFFLRLLLQMIWRSVDGKGQEMRTSGGIEILAFGASNNACHVVLSCSSVEFIANRSCHEYVTMFQSWCLPQKSRNEFSPSDNN